MRRGGVIWDSCRRLQDLAICNFQLVFNIHLDNPPSETVKLSKFFVQATNEKTPSKDGVSTH